jgi:hypothetical protein
MTEMILKKEALYFLFACLGAAISLLILHALPGRHNWTDAKMVFPLGALIGACIAYCVNRWL